MMNKFLYLLLILLTTVGLVACGLQKDDQMQDEENAVETSNSENTDEEAPDTGDGSVTSHETNTDEDDQKDYQNDVFKEVAVTKSVDQISVTGKAQVFEGYFQYELYDGDQVIMEEGYQTEGAPAWGEFTITFEKNLISTDHATLELFFYSQKDGSKTNVLEVPIDK